MAETKNWACGKVGCDNWFKGTCPPNATPTSSLQKCKKPVKTVVEPDNKAI